MENRESSYYRKDSASRPPQREDAPQRASTLFTELPLDSVRRTPSSGRPAPEYTGTANENRRAARRHAYAHCALLPRAPVEDRLEGLDVAVAVEEKRAFAAEVGVLAVSVDEAHFGRAARTADGFVVERHFEDVELVARDFECGRGFVFGGFAKKRARAAYDMRFFAGYARV